MVSLDVNILIYAYWKDAPERATISPWLERLVSSGSPFTVFDVVGSSFLRIVTHPGVFSTPDPFNDAYRFLQVLRESPSFVHAGPGSRHWEIFIQLCRAANARGRLISDAFLAAMAIESDCDFITTDGDFARFPGLKWRNPLSEPRT